MIRSNSTKVRNVPHKHLAVKQAHMSNTITLAQSKHGLSSRKLSQILCVLLLGVKRVATLSC